jgi:hypothetical protein
MMRGFPQLYLSLGDPNPDGSLAARLYYKPPVIADAFGGAASAILLLLAALPSSAVAQCTNTAPGSGTTVTCSGSSSTPVIAAPGSTGVTINVLSGASVSGSHVSAVPFPLLSVEQSSIITNNGALAVSGGGGSGTNRGAAMLGNGNPISSPMPRARRSAIPAPSTTAWPPMAAAICSSTTARSRPAGPMHTG